MSDTRESPYRSTHRLEEVDVVNDDGSTTRLVRKHVGRPGPGPRELYDAQREIHVYERLLPHAPPGAAACRATSHEHRWLLLERVAGVQLPHAREFRSWLRTAAWLGAFHRRFIEAAANHTAPLIVCDESFYSAWLERARHCVGHQLEDLSEAYAFATRRLAALPRTVLHGDCYPSNIIVTEGARPRVCPVDWEMAAVGPGLIDFAALSTGWDAAHTDRMLTAYCAAFDGVATRTLRQSLDCCRLYLAVRMLGWSADWSPPNHHAFNWMLEASTVAERVVRA